jgi:hypothetical protein
MADPYKNNVVLYLPMEGSNHGDTVISDRTGKTVTRNGDVILSTAIVPPLGTMSAYFDGTNDYLNITSTAYSSPLTFGTKNFTIELWYYCTDSAGTGRVFYDTRHNGQTNWPYGLAFGIYNGYFWLWYNASQRLAGTITAPHNVWTHYALSRVGPTLYLAVNGIVKWTYDISTNPVYCGDNRPIIGSVGDSPGTYSFLGYIKDLKVTVDIARYGNETFSPSQTTTVADDYWSNVVLAIHGEGTGTTFTDVSNTARTITTVGNTIHSTSVAPPFGTSSIYFDGSGDYLSMSASNDWMFGTGDFTIELWVRPGAINVQQGFYTHGSSTTRVEARLENAAPYFYISLVGNYGHSLTSNINLTVNTWNHLAYVRYAGYMYIFVNGINAGTPIADSTNITESASAYVSYQPSYGMNINGYIKDLRVTKGIARYTQNFNPWRVQDPYYKDSVLLVSGEGSGATFADDSPTPKTITANGNVTHSSAIVPPFGSTSIYFDGAGDYLSLADSADWAFGTGDFTIEFWMKSSGNGSWDQIIAQRNSAGQTNSDNPWSLTRDSTTGKLMFSYWNGSAGVNTYTTSIVFDNSWRHIAVSRRDTIVRIFVDGVAENSATLSANFSFYDSTKLLSIGRAGEYDGQYYLGYLKDLRVIKGVAKYTSDFTPVKVPAQIKSNGAPIAFADKTAIKTIANSYDWDSPEPVRIML